MEYSLIKYLDCFSHLDEDVAIDYNGERTPVKNPLPVPSPAKLAVIFSTLDEIEDKYVEEYSGNIQNSNPYEFGNIVKQIQKDKGVEKEVPINKLISLEPELDANHLLRLRNNKVKFDPNKLPIVYILNSGNYIGDGNHRVIYKLLQGKKKVKALVIDFRKDEQELM